MIKNVSIFPNAVDYQRTNVDNPKIHSFEDILNIKALDTYARIKYNRGMGALSQIIYTFDFSPIPQEASIISLTLKVHGSHSAYDYNDIPTEGVCLSKGDPSSDGQLAGNPLGNSLSNVITLDETLKEHSYVYSHLVSRNELDRVFFLLFAYRGWGYEIFYSDIYSIEVVVEYEIEDTPPPDVHKLYLKNGYQWNIISTSYKKISGQWKLIDDTTNLFDKDTSYIINQ